MRLLFVLLVAIATPVVVVCQQPSLAVRPLPYRNVITDKASSSPGLFTVHKIEDHWYFEIPDSLLNRPILLNTRLVKSPTPQIGYGGSFVRGTVFYFEKAPGDKIFIKILSTENIARDSMDAVMNAVTVSNWSPIALSFPIKAYGKTNDGSGSSVIDLTDFLLSENPLISLRQSNKQNAGLGTLIAERSFVEWIHSYPGNIEVRTVKTFSASGADKLPPALEAASAATIELNNSFLLLPRKLMRKRLSDRRVGYYESQPTILYADNQQRIEKTTFIDRWRLEPKERDLNKFKRGELVEPQTPIVFYIDPATPKKWRSYMIAGINAWQASFERIGFKNAIVGREWPENDSTMSMEDTRFSVVRYQANDSEGAWLETPFITDPRSGEILSSRINYSAGIMKWMHDCYMTQCGMVDPRSRKMEFDDELMGKLISYVICHEVGHALGLQHNMLSSSTIAVANLRSKDWTAKYGISPSIMDYARFNFVAQPEDSITTQSLINRIGEYDRWAILWGYKPILGTANETEDVTVLNQWIIDSISSNPRLEFGADMIGQGGRDNPDPRAQPEDLGDDPVLAGSFGIKNLKGILLSLPSWTKEATDQYNNLKSMYLRLLTQFNYYMRHAVKNIGGVMESYKSIEQTGDVYDIIPKPKQQRAVDFLSRQLFTTPDWLLNKSILNKIGTPAGFNAIAGIQSDILSTLLSPTQLYGMEACKAAYGSSAYAADELLSAVTAELWKELKTATPIDVFRRILQKKYLDALESLIKKPLNPTVQYPLSTPTLVYKNNTWTTDIPSIAKAQLKELQSAVKSAIGKQSDRMSKLHLADVQERIRVILHPLDTN